MNSWRSILAWQVQPWLDEKIIVNPSIMTFEFVYEAIIKAIDKLVAERYVSVGIAKDYIDEFDNFDDTAYKNLTYKELLTDINLYTEIRKTW